MLLENGANVNLRDRVSHMCSFVAHAHAHAGDVSNVVASERIYRRHARRPMVGNSSSRISTLSRQGLGSGDPACFRLLLSKTADEHIHISNNVRLAVHSVLSTLDQRPEMVRREIDSFVSASRSCSLIDS